MESVDVLNPERAYERIGEALRELLTVEAARARDAELIQRLVDAIAYDGSRVPEVLSAMRAASDAGYKPTKP